MLLTASEEGIGSKRNLIRRKSLAGQLTQFFSLLGLAHKHIH